MDNVVDFPSKPERYSTGEAICRACKHTFEAAVPQGVFHFECPSCNERKAVFRNVFGGDEGEYEYGCANCGGVDFYIHKKTATSVPTVRCRGCGIEHTSWFE